MNVYEELVSLLKEKNYKVTFAESCTGGLLSAYLVSVAGASSVFDGGFVTYSEKMKHDTVDVKMETVSTFGVVSENVAVEMATGAAKRAKADVSVGITGYAGPKKDEKDTAAGTVCFGFFVNGKTVSSTKYFGDIGRNAVRELAANYAASTLIKLIRTFGDN